MVNLKEKLNTNKNYSEGRKFNEEICQDVKAAVTDLYLYDAYKTERSLFEKKSKKAQAIHLHFKIKYGIRLFESNDADVYEAIFGRQEV